MRQKYQLISLLLLLLALMATGCSTDQSKESIPVEQDNKKDYDCPLLFVDGFNKVKDDQYSFNDYCPESYYPEIYVVDPGDTFEIKKNLYEFVNLLMAAYWRFYTELMFIVIGFLSWAFNLKIIIYIANIYPSIINALKDNIFDDLLYLLFACAIAWAVYYWAVGKKTQMWRTLFNIVLIQALILLFFGAGEYKNDNNPFRIHNILEGATNVSASISNSILAGFTKDIGAKCVGDNKDGQENKADSNQEGDHKKVINNTKDTLYCLLISYPYQIVNFGSIERANENGNWKVMLEKETKEEKKNFIKELVGDGDDIQNSPYKQLTEHGVLDRAIDMIFMTIIGIVIGGGVLVVCILVLTWQFIAIGRGIIGVFYLIISLWPEYGLREAVQWFWSMLQALFMKVLYTIFLAVYSFMMITVLSSEQIVVDGQKAGYDIKIILLIGLMVGLWQAMNELRSKVQEIPLGNGINLAGAKETPITQAIQDKAMEYGVKKPLDFGMKYGVKKPFEYGVKKPLNLGKKLGKKLWNKGVNKAKDPVRKFYAKKRKNEEFYINGIRNTLKANKLKEREEEGYRLAGKDVLESKGVLKNPKIQQPGSILDQTQIDQLPGNIPDRLVNRAVAEGVNLSEEAYQMVSNKIDLLDTSKLKKEIEKINEEIGEIESELGDIDRADAVDIETLKISDKLKQELPKLKHTLKLYKEIEAFNQKDIFNKLKITGQTQENRGLGLVTSDPVAKIVIDKDGINKAVANAINQLGISNYSSNSTEIPLTVAAVAKEMAGMNPDALKAKLLEAYKPEWNQLQNQLKSHFADQFKQISKEIQKNAEDAMKNINKQILEAQKSVGSIARRDKIVADLKQQKLDIKKETEAAYKELSEKLSKMYEKQKKEILSLDLATFAKHIENNFDGIDDLFNSN